MDSQPGTFVAMIYTMIYLRFSKPSIGGFVMLRAAVMFFALALIAIVLGASGIAGVSLEIGRMLLGVFLILAVLSFIGSLVTGRNSKLLP